jgi:hypothetical protein
MDTMRKWLILSGGGALGVVGIVLLGTALRHRRHAATGAYKKVGKGIDERLRESKGVLDKAVAHVQSVVEQITNRKP